MSDLSRLSLNTATAKHATLAECTSACAEAGLGWIGPWRDRIQGVSNDEAARIISEAGLKASTVCRGGFLTGTDADSLPGAIAENTRALEEAAAVGASELVMVVGGLPTGDKDIVAARQRVADRLGDLVSIARDHGVRLALEPMHPLFTDVVGVVVDTYHVWWDPQARESIARAGREGRISSYQICDWILPLAAETLNSRGFPGDGYIDFPTITQ